MRRRTAVLVAVGVATALAAPALAALPDGSAGPWADNVIEFQQGLRSDGTPVPATRSDPEAALGAAEAGTAEGTFFSLGFGGKITLHFENKICNGSSSPDLDLYLEEDTIEPYPAELVDVFVSPDNVTYTQVADNVDKDASIAFPASITVAQHYVRLVDVSDPGAFAGRPPADGYDVDGVRAGSSTDCPEKVGAGRMTGGGSLFLANGTRVTHGFTLRCNDPASGGNDLQVNWDTGNKFHLETVSQLVCYDAAGYDEGQPDAGFDTLEGTALGRFNGVSGYKAQFKLTDAGEPGTSDFGHIRITSPTNAVVLDVQGLITKGNQQAHNAG